MKNIRWIIALLLLVGYGAAFGQTEEQQILKKEFMRIQAGMVKDACDIMDYNNEEVRKKLDPNSFNVITFSTALKTDPNIKKKKSKESFLLKIIEEANGSGTLPSITGTNYSKDLQTINAFKDNLKNAFKREDGYNLSCFTRKDKQSKLTIVENKYKEWESSINQLDQDYQAFTIAKTTEQWDSYILNTSHTLFNNLAENKKKEKEEEEDFNIIQSLHSYNDAVKCQEFINAHPGSKYIIQVENKKKALEGLKKEKTVEAENEFKWTEGDGKTYKKSGAYQYQKGDSILILHLTIKEKLQEEKPNDKSEKFLNELKECKTRDAVESLLNKKNYLDDKYKEYADDSYWVLCTDSIGWKKYISFYGENGGHYTDATTKLEEARKPETVETKEERTTNQTDLEEEKQNAVNGGADGSGSGGANGAGGTSDVNKPLPKGLWYLLAGIIVSALILAFILSKRKKSQSQAISADKELREENAAYERCSTISACDYYLNTYPSGRFVKEVIAKKEGLLDKIKKEEDDAFKACTTVTACDYYLIKYPKGRYVNEVKERKTKLAESNNPKPKPEPENKPNQEPKQKQGEWVVVGASVKGNGHIESNMPCQDNSKFEILGKGWGVAVVSDGAGSAAHSDMGSKVVVERGTLHFKNLVEKEGWMDKNTLPSDAEWLQKSYFVLKTIRNEVEMVAKKNNVDLKSLSATCLAVVFSPLGLLAVHVGDGRMGCKTAADGWKAIMTPHKGDEANQTLFLISEFWDIPNYVQSGVLVPESIVVREPVDAFAVMSDGCESTAWLCTAQNAETGKYYDQNKPFEGFFNPLEETLASFHKDNVPEEERKEKWYKFIESGTKGFVKEQDDKTMILGVFL
jgi:hypothetical protein